MTQRIAHTALAVLILVVATLPERVTADAHDPKVSAEQLQARIMAFADTYMNVLAEEYVRLDALGLTAEQRLYLHTRKLLSASAAISIASGPDVVQNLLDMFAMVTLSRMIIDEPWVEKKVGVDATNLRAIAADFEKKIWGIAADVTSEEQLQGVRNHLNDYRRRHPDERAAYFVRFDEGAAMRGTTSLTEKVRDSGLLSSVSDAGQAVDEVRQTAERALFVGNRMPILVGWQVEKILYTLALSPEFQKMSATPEALKLSIDNLSASIEVIPGLVTSERKAVLAALDDKEGALTGTVAELHAALSEAIAVLPQVEALAATAERTVASGGETSVALNQMLATSERLIERIEKDGDRYDRFVGAIPELGVTATKLEGLMASVEGILGKDFSFESLIDQIFWRAVVFVIIFFAAMLAAGVLYKIAVHRWASGSSPA